MDAALNNYLEVNEIVFFKIKPKYKQTIIFCPYASTLTYSFLSAESDLPPPLFLGPLAAI